LKLMKCRQPFMKASTSRAASQSLPSGGKWAASMTSVVSFY